MNQLRTVSRGVWLVFTLSLILSGTGWFAALKWRPVAADSSGEFAALKVEREQLRGNEDDVRVGLRQKRDALRGEEWTASARAALPAQFGNGWMWEWSGTDRATLRRVNPRMEDWFEYMAVIQQLAARPGLIVDSFEVRVDSIAHQRRFAVVSIGLRFITADAPVSDGERAAPNRAPLTVAPAAGPAPTQKVGPVSPLRRPDASAEPPAPGPVSASFRPDPPGSPAGIPTNQNPQDKSP